MARRRSKMRRNRRMGPGHNEANRQTRESRSKESMLDTSREAHFRYDIEEFLLKQGMPPEEIRPFLQTLWARGSRNSIDDAKDWVKESAEDGRIDEDAQRECLRLIKKYSTYR